jgi:hypothetical protein
MGNRVSELAFLKGLGDTTKILVTIIGILAKF